ncbi:phage tail protein [Pseudomonas sp. NPDC087697]|uniref:phage tail protein n=1 Tax=Pseudomonas sp. NPDC087697 TaxID=3364447 RepID=UPI00380833BD
MDFPKRVPGVGLVNGKFVDEDPLVGSPGSLIPAQWGNAVTLEILGVIESVGWTPDEDNNAQLLAATNIIIDRAITQRTASTVVTIAASRQLLPAEMGLVLINAAAAATTITLPAANADLGIKDVIVRRTDNGGNRLVIQAAGADKIKFHTHLNAAGYSFLVLMGAGDWWRLRSDGTGSWWPVGRYDSAPLGRPVFEGTTLFNPGGYGALNGAVLKRAEWPWLWDHAQQSGMLTTEAARGGMEGGWTSGDGVLTFRAPDGRGEFFRALDESRGVDAGRVAGSRQKGTLVSYDDASTGWSIDVVRSFSAAETGGDLINVGAEYPSVVNSYTVSGVTNGGVPSGSAARPRNIAYPGRIKLI